jgi:hypothetical protein
VIGAIVSKLAANVGKAKTSPIGPYLFHLYHHAELLSDAQMVECTSRSTIVHYGLTNEVEAKQSTIEEEEDREEEEQLLDQRQRKSTDPSSRGKLPAQDKVLEEEEDISRFF